MLQPIHLNDLNGALLLKNCIFCNALYFNVSYTVYIYSVKVTDDCSEFVFSYIYIYNFNSGTLNVYGVPTIGMSSVEDNEMTVENQCNSESTDIDGVHLMITKCHETTYEFR